MVHEIFFLLRHDTYLKNSPLPAYITDWMYGQFINKRVYESVKPLGNKSP